MADIKTFWPDPGMPMSTDLGGDSITASGSDPNITIQDGKDQACDPIWENFPVPYIGGEETPNSVSGLPQLPNRFEPAGSPPEPPTLQDRRPGTIDER